MGGFCHSLVTGERLSRWAVGPSVNPFKELYKKQFATRMP
jgi:hypothetical protein